MRVPNVSFVFLSYFLKIFDIHKEPEVCLIRVVAPKWWVSICRNFLAVQSRIVHLII